ncbi:MAG TPA: IS256 family transposase [Terriglobales bacterium]|nr:IS256 family transposase [Terriglobales bacterium]
MAKIVSITEHFQHFLADLKESFWGDLEARTRLSWKRLFESESERLRDAYAVRDSYERGPRRPGQYRNGYYERDFVTRFGTIRLRIARARGKSFLPPGLEKFQRRAPELALLIREAFLRGISTRQVGRVVATLTGEVVSAQTVSNLTRDLDEAVKQFHQAPLKDEWAYLFLDGVALKVRRPAGRQHVQMLVAYGVRQDGVRQLLGFLRTRGEGQAHWEALLNDLYRRGLKGDKLLLVVTDGCPGLAAAIQTVYPRVAHQRCWVHKMRNILDKVRKRDYDAVKIDAQAIYLADGYRSAQAAARAFSRRWRPQYASMVKQLDRDLPDLLAFYRFPKHLWRKLRTTNIIERCFVEVRRRTRPMVCFVNVQSVDRIIYSIFQRFNLEWKTRTLRAFTQAA